MDQSSRVGWFALLATVCSLFAVADAAAQQPSQAQIGAVRSACRSDYMAHCSSVPPGGKASLACLQKNAASLSAPCQNAVNALGGGDNAAAPASTAQPASPEASPAAPPPAHPPLLRPRRLRPRPALALPWCAPLRRWAPARKCGLSASPAGPISACCAAVFRPAAVASSSAFAPMKPRYRPRVGKRSRACFKDNFRQGRLGRLSDMG